MISFYQMLEAMDAISSQELEMMKLGQRSIKLPPERPGFVRYLHRTNHPNLAESILQNGLDYSNQGMLRSTATQGNDSLELGFGDNRFNAAGVVVMDIPEQEARLHENPSQSPGKVPPEYILGWFNNLNNFTWEPNPKYGKTATPQGSGPVQQAIEVLVDRYAKGQGSWQDLTSGIQGLIQQRPELKDKILAYFNKHPRVFGKKT